MTPVNTTRRIPPPGPNRRTLGTNPLYSELKPSSFITVPRAGQAQLYFGVEPATLTLFWIRDLTTSMGVLRIVPAVPPTVPAMTSLRICWVLFPGSGVGIWARTWKIQPK